MGNIGSGRAGQVRRPAHQKPRRRGQRRGSLTVEAALAVPLFFFCVTAIIYMMNAYGRYATQVVRLQQQAEQMAGAAGAAAAARDTAAELTDGGGTAAGGGSAGGGASSESGGAGEASGGSGAGGDGYIDLRVPVQFPLRFFPGVSLTSTLACRARVRPWTGGDPAEVLSGDEAEDELVYVTNHRSVYHTSADCSYLDLHIRAVGAAQAEQLHNSSGHKYHACEKCVGRGGKNAVLYITEDGDCYHNSQTCSGLVRTTRLVPRSEVKDLPLCSRCAAHEAHSHAEP